MRRLGDLAEMYSGATPSRGQLQHFGGSTPWAKIQDLTRAGMRLTETEEYVSAMGLEAARLRVFPIGTVLLAMYGSIGTASIAAIPTTTNQAILGIQCGAELDPDYLWFYLKMMQPQLASRGRGGTQANINATIVRDLEIPARSLSEQRRITAHLGGGFAAVRAARDGAMDQLHALRSLRAQAYDSAFAHVVPFSVSEQVTSSPSGWRWHKLTDLARLATGHTPSRDRPDWWQGDIPWIALLDIRRFDGKITFDATEMTNAEGIANSSARVLPTDTIVMSRTASVGFVTRMGRPMATSQDFVNWVCGPGLDPEFLMHLLIRSRDEIRALSSGAIHKTVYFPTVKAFRVCVPSIDDQRRIAAELRDRLAATDAVEASIRAEREAIEALPAALLRRAFEDLAA